MSGKNKPTEPMTVHANCEGKMDPALFAEIERNGGLGQVVIVGRLPGGMASGRSSVLVVIRMPDGKHYAAETSMRLWHGANAVMVTAEKMEGSPQ